MDPDEALARYQAAFASGDMPARAEARDALIDWKRGGGFPPKGGWPAEVRLNA